MQRMTTCQAQESLKNVCKVPVAKFKPRSSNGRNFPFTYSQTELFIFGSQTCCTNFGYFGTFEEGKLLLFVGAIENFRQKGKRAHTCVMSRKENERKFTELKENKHSPEVRKCKNGSGEMQEPVRRVQRKEDRWLPAVTICSVDRGLKQHKVLTPHSSEVQNSKTSLIVKTQRTHKARPSGSLKGNKGSIPLFLPLEVKCLPQFRTLSLHHFNLFCTNSHPRSFSYMVACENTGSTEVAWDKI